MSRKSWMDKRKERRIAWSKNANAAKARKRMVESSAAVEVGVVRFDGPLFGGSHVVRLTHWDGERAVMVDVDGVPYRPRTVRGMRALIARRVMR